MKIVFQILSTKTEVQNEAMRLRGAIVTVQSPLDVSLPN